MWAISITGGRIVRLDNVHPVRRRQVRITETRKPER
jgi:hypothetical protein